MNDFVELTARSYFSFLEGASSPDELAHVAASKGISALGLVDRNGLYGAASFYRVCKELGIKPIIGSQLTVEDGDEVIVLCLNLAGYQKLSQVITQAYRGRSKGDPVLSMLALQQLRGDVVCVVGAKIGFLGKDNRRAGRERLSAYVNVFGQENVYVALANHKEAGDAVLCRKLAALAFELGLPLIATNAPCYAEKSQGRLHDVLLCIKNRTKISESTRHRSGNHQRYLKAYDEMQVLFKEHPKAIFNSITLAARCNLELDFSCYRFPDFPVPEGYTVDSYLKFLVKQALPKKYPNADGEVMSRVEQELHLISKLKLGGYFLVVWDIVQFARKKYIPVQGRGSAANSVVTYILGMTPVDPITHNLFLGRFIHEEMQEVPDIDLDFASTRQEGMANREDVIQYVYQRYGADHVAMVCTYITFQAKSAIREVGQVLGLPERLIDRMARLVGRYGISDVFGELERTEDLGDYLGSGEWAHFKKLVEEITDIPRHISIHVGGMLIASCPIANIVPLEPARMEGRVVCQWDKDMVGDAGLVKVDILGLGMLAVLREAVSLIVGAGGPQVNLGEITYDDPAIYQTIGRADTVGVFQVESRAQMQSLPRTRPSNFHELGVQVAIIRPGPLQGNMVAPYIRRKQGEEAVSYMHPSLKSILGDTLGVILFQEQVLLCAVAIAGFTPSQADALRRAMSRKRSVQAMQKMKESFLVGAKANGVSERDAIQVYQSLEGFALYGFCKSHALSFASISYVSAWLKVYHPAAFLAALLNNQPMGFYPIETLIEDTKRHGVQVLPVCVNSSRERSYAVDSSQVQLGFNLIKGLSSEGTKRIVQLREAKGPFQSLRDFVRRVHLRRQSVENLIEAGALDGFGLERRELLWQLWLLHRMGLFEEDLFAGFDFKSPSLPKSGPWDLLKGEYRTQGFSVRQHPVALLRDELSRKGVITSRMLPGLDDDAQVKVAGLVVCRQRPPTAKGFAFLTIEDECGMMNVIVPPKLYESVRAVFRTSSLVLVSGLCHERSGVINVKATELIGI